MVQSGQKNYNSLSTPRENGHQENVTEIPPSRRRFRLRWKPSSKEEFAASEKKLLSYLNVPHEVEDVDAGEVRQFGGCFGCRTSKIIKVQLPTLFVNRSRPGIPLVLFPGLGMGFAFFVPLMKAIAYHGPVISVDLPGFGRSTRFKFSKNGKDAESTHIKILEAWRSTLGLERFVICGLSFGGFLGTSYAIRYPEKVVHLVLMDAWGFPEKPKKVTSLIDEHNAITIRLMAMASSRMSVFTPYRLLGPWGPEAFYNFGDVETINKRTDEQLGVEGAVNDLNDYCYHCITEDPTGEDSFRHMSKWIVYAKEPLCRRIHQLKVPTTMIVAEKSWVPCISGEELKRQVGPECQADFIIIPSATHEDISSSKGLEDILRNLIMKEGWVDKEVG